MKRLSEKVRSDEYQLHERKLDELELRREKSVMEMEDYLTAMAKANGEVSEEGEQRIVVK